MPYVFLNLEALQTPAEKLLAGTISKYWGTFVNTGDPNSPEDRKEGSIAGVSINLYHLHPCCYNYDLVLALFTLKRPYI